MQKLLILSILIFLGSTYIQTEEWFDNQLLDHTSPMSKETWKQRFFVVSDYYTPGSGSVLLYICGEYTCPGVNPDRLFVLDLAQRYKSLVLVLEHRYYGKSMPYGDVSLQTQNLRHLNVQQALDDLAYFQLWVKQTQLHGVTSVLPWYTVGGSYPGALSAWFRYKYPHLTVAALASSAVVNSIEDFPQFDGQIYTSTQKSGNQCTKVIQEITFKAQTYLSSKDSDAFKLQFGPTFVKLNNGEFLFMLADAFVGQVQYGSRTTMCGAITSTSDPMKWIQDFVIANVNAGEYGSYYLKDDTYDSSKSSRQWMYQTCSEVGWFQTAPWYNPKSMRSSQLNITFYKQLCRDTFGIEIWPNVQVTNSRFGGYELNVDRLIMTNGDEDPWKHASITYESPIQKFQVFDIICDNCAHCVELYTVKESDSNNLKSARSAIIALLDEWII